MGHSGFNPLYVHNWRGLIRSDSESMRPEMWTNHGKFWAFSRYLFVKSVCEDFKNINTPLTKHTYKGIPENFKNKHFLQAKTRNYGIIFCVFFVTKSCLYVFWTLHKKTDILISDMTHSERKKNFLVYIRRAWSADCTTSSAVQLAEKHFGTLVIFLNEFLFVLVISSGLSFSYCNNLRCLMWTLYCELWSTECEPVLQIRIRSDLFGRSGIRTFVTGSRSEATKIDIFLPFLC
jgi:hypothetical protein